MENGLIDVYKGNRVEYSPQLLPEAELDVSGEGALSMALRLRSWGVRVHHDVYFTYLNPQSMLASPGNSLLVCDPDLADASSGRGSCRKAASHSLERC